MLLISVKAMATEPPAATLSLKFDCSINYQTLLDGMRVRVMSQTTGTTVEMTLRAAIKRAQITISPENDANCYTITLAGESIYNLRWDGTYTVYIMFDNTIRRTDGTQLITDMQDGSELKIVVTVKMPSSQDTIDGSIEHIIFDFGQDMDTTTAEDGIYITILRKSETAIWGYIKDVNNFIGSWDDGGFLEAVNEANFCFLEVEPKGSGQRFYVLQKVFEDSFNWGDSIEVYIEMGTKTKFFSKSFGSGDIVENLNGSPMPGLGFGFAFGEKMTTGGGSGGEIGQQPTTVTSDGIVPSAGTGTVPDGSTASNVTNNGTIENHGTIKDSTNKGIIISGTVTGIIENAGGTLKDVTIAKETTIKSGKIKGSVTVGTGAKLENVNVVAGTTLSVMGTGVQLTVVLESDSEIHLAPGSAVQGIIRSPEGATINIPEGAIVPIEGKAVVIRFTNPTIPGFASFAQLTIPALPEGYTLVDALTICPEGYKLSTPATITISYDKTKIPSGFTKGDLLVLAVDPEKGDWVSVEVKEVTEDTVTIETDILSTYAVVVPVAIEYPTLKLYIRDLVDPSNKENVYHFTEKVYDTRGTPHIYVNTIKTGTGKVDIYAKCTYPDGKSAWLYFDADGLVRFHDECAAEWSNITFDELTDYILIHGAWWFDKSKEAEWKLSMPTGEYTWKVIVVKHGGDIEKTEDIICESEAKLILEY